MRVLPAGLLLAMLQTGSSQSATMVGRVVDASTRKPVAGAVVELAEPHALISRQQLSDEFGRFAFLLVPLGTSKLRASAAGYLASGFRAASPDLSFDTVTLNRANGVGSLEIRLWPASGIKGTVSDGAGQPLAGVAVRGFRLRSLDVAPSVFWPPLESLTNDLGEYAFVGLEPGAYIVGIVRSALGSVSGKAVVLASSFYPGAASPSAAVPIDLGRSEVRRGVNLIGRQKPASVVSGRITGADNRAPVEVRLVPGNASDIRFDVTGYSTSADASGAFRLGDVSPGTYTVVAWQKEGARWAEMPIAVADRDMDDLVVTLHGGVFVRGMVTIDGGPASMNEWSVSIQPESFDPRDPPRTRSSAPVAGDGAYELGPLLPGRYDFAVSAASRRIGWVVMDGQKQTVRPISLSSGEQRIDLVLTLMGSIEGSVSLPEGIASKNVEVLLFPARSSDWGDVNDERIRFRRLSIAAPGRFSLAGVIPGDYRLVAVVDGTAVTNWRRRQTLAALGSLGAAVTVSAAKRSQVSLSLSVLK